MDAKFTVQFFLWTIAKNLPSHSSPPGCECILIAPFRSCARARRCRCNRRRRRRPRWQVRLRCMIKRLHHHVLPTFIFFRDYFGVVISHPTERGVGFAQHHFKKLIGGGAAQREQADSGGLRKNRPLPAPPIVDGRQKSVIAAQLKPPSHVPHHRNLRTPLTGSKNLSIAMVAVRYGHVGADRKERRRHSPRPPSRSSRRLALDVVCRVQQEPLPEVSMNMSPGVSGAPVNCVT